MKKRCVVLVFSCLFLLLFSGTAALAADVDNVYDSCVKECQIERFEDGSYAIDETTVYIPAGSAVKSAFLNKSASRTYTYFESSNNKAWSFTINGSFRYNGTTAYAVDASCSSRIYANGWSCTSKSATYSNAVAKGTGTFRCLSLTKSISIGLKCAADGTITNVNY